MSSSSAPQVVFAFGPNNGFFFEYNGTRKWNNLPAGLLKILNAGGEDAVRRTFCLALNEVGGYLVTYEDWEGVVKYASENIPQPLKAWIDDDGGIRIFRSDKVRLSSLRFSLGASGAFYITGAASNATGIDERHSRWQGVTSSLEEELQRCTTTSHASSYKNMWTATIGEAGTYFLYQMSTDGDNRHVYNFTGAPSDDLKRLIRNIGDMRGFYVVMNPYRRNEFFCLRLDGSAEWRVNKRISRDIDIMARKIFEDRQSVSGSTGTQRELPPSKYAETVEAAKFETEVAPQGLSETVYKGR